MAREFPPRVISDWLNSKSVDSGELAAELREWADFADPYARYARHAHVPHEDGIAKIWIDTETGTYGDIGGLVVVDIPEGKLTEWDEGGVTDSEVSLYGIQHGRPAQAKPTEQKVM